MSDDFMGALLRHPTVASQGGGVYLMRHGRTALAGRPEIEMSDDFIGALLRHPTVASQGGVVYLMRHGRTALDVARRSDGWLDLPLSDEGRLGLIPTQQKLKMLPIKTIYAADLQRTEETAKIIKSGILSDPDVEIARKARTWNLGILSGMKKVYGRPEVQKLIDSPNEKPTGGESFNEFKGRFWVWFTNTVPSLTETVLYVGSGSNLRLIGQELTGDPECADLDEAGLAKLTHKDGVWTCKVIMGEDDIRDEIS